MTWAILLIPVLAFGANEEPVYFLDNLEEERAADGINQNFRAMSRGIRSAVKLDEDNTITGSNDFTGTGPSTFTVSHTSITIGQSGDSLNFGADTISFQSGIALAVVSPSTPAANTIYKESYLRAWGTLDGTGTPAWDTNTWNFDTAAVADGGAGIYSVTFYTDFDATDYVCSCTTTSGGHFCAITSFPATGITINVVDHAGNAADVSGIMIMCAGNQ